MAESYGILQEPLTGLTLQQFLATHCHLSHADPPLLLSHATSPTLPSLVFCQATGVG
jgi:hypothetical protein